MKHEIITVKIAFFITFCFSLSSADLISGVYYNPGLKLGVQFGKTTDFLLGFENSITAAMLYGMPFCGLVGGIAFNFKRKKFIEYLEIEGGFIPLGIAFGGEWNDGYHGSFRVFSGALGYLSYKHLFKTSIHEISLIGKHPYGLYEVTDHGVYSVLN